MGSSLIRHKGRGQPIEMMSIGKEASSTHQCGRSGILEIASGMGLFVVEEGTNNARVLLHLVVAGNMIQGRGADHLSMRAL